MCTAAGAALAANVSLASPVAAQGDPTSLVGNRVRLTTSQVSFTGVIGRVVSVEGEYIVLDRSAANDHPNGPIRIALADIEKVELSAGHRRNAGKGAWIGGVSGLLAGASLGALEVLPCLFCDGARAEHAAVYGAAGAAAGALVGVAIGALVKSERWDEVPPERWSVSHHARSGFSLAVRIAL